MAPKLTKQHVQCSSFDKQSVSRAGQTLSNAVAKGIRACIALGEMPAEDEPTAEFCENMNVLFDAFNSKTKTSQKRRYSCKYCQHASQRKGDDKHDKN